MRPHRFNQDTTSVYLVEHSPAVTLNMPSQAKGKPLARETPTPKYLLRQLSPKSSISDKRSH